MVRAKIKGMKNAKMIKILAHTSGIYYTS